MIRIHPALPALPFRPQAIEDLFRWGVKVEVRDPTKTTGGGFWWPDAKKVELFTGQTEAAIHETAHAFWHRRRLEGTNAAELMVAVVKLSEERDPRYAQVTALAHHYVYGIRSQVDPNSPTGWWRGMLVDGNDWEMFAGLASSTMGRLSQLPPYVRRFYADLLDPDPSA